MSSAIEKIISDHIGRKVHAGEFVETPIDLIYFHDGTGILVFKHLEEMLVKKVGDVESIVFFDHSVPPHSIEASTLQKYVLESSRKFGISKIYFMGEGIGHQVIHEEGHVKPGQIIIGADSHTPTLGALGVLALGVGALDAAYGLATGKLWLKVPETLLITVEGRIPKGVYAKDIILHIIGSLRAYGALGKVVEFSGSVTERLNVDSRFTLCNMSVEMGAASCFQKIDEKTINYLKNFGVCDLRKHFSDKDSYVEEYFFDISSLEPQVSCPHSVDNVKSISEVEGTPVDQIFIGSCTNGRLEDLVEVAKILKNGKVKPYVKLIIVPASKRILMKAMSLGLIEIFLKAGAMVGVPGCGPCLGMHTGVLGDDEVAISTSSRNFIGRMGSRKAKIYLASPATAAASALTGEITDPRRFLK